MNEKSYYYFHDIFCWLIRKQFYNGVLVECEIINGCIDITSLVKSLNGELYNTILEENNELDYN